MHVTIKNKLKNSDVFITEANVSAVRASFNPSGNPEVDKLKLLAAAFLSLCDEVGSSREMSVAKTNMETAVMWAVKAATASKA